MSHIRVLICRLDDPASDQMTALATFDLPETDLTTLKPETALDDLETTTHTTGNAILQRTLQAQWDVIDDQLTVQHRQSFPPRSIHADGHEPITVASRFGMLTLSRQVCQHLATQTHVLPSNAVLPPHNGIITRGLQEWAWLLSAVGLAVKHADGSTDNTAQPCRAGYQYQLVYQDSLLLRVRLLFDPSQAAPT
jgi:hypothetical protein